MIKFQINTTDLSSTRKKILRYLLTKSSMNQGWGCTIKDIATTLDLSPNAIRQHLTILEKEGLIVRTEKHGKTGRPAIVYSLHENAMDTFPKRYDELSLLLLDELEKSYGREETVKLLKNVGKGIAMEIAEDLTDMPEDIQSDVFLKQKLQHLVQILKTYGKFPELHETESSFELKNYNCFVYKLSKANPLICKVDETMMSALIGHEVTKEQCIRDGDNCCSYRISKSKS
ncbi:MAG: helix-turn-helix transcriptional regulator [Promethearchaeota archaeon]